MSQKNYLDFAGLTAYDKKIKAWIKSGLVDITDDEIRALFATKDVVFYGIKCLEQRPIVETTYEEVDLGLSVKWANKNIGAETPQDNGYYFSWGSTTNAVCFVDGGGVPQDELIKVYLYDYGYSYDDITPELIQGVKDQYGDNLESELKTYFNDNYGADTWGIISNYIFDWENTPYCTVDENGNPVFSKYNRTDGITVLEAMDDTATVIMGDDWRMPTSAETIELVSGTDQYGVKEDGTEVPRSTMTSNDTYIGMKFVSKAEGNNNSIFFPFAGMCGSSSLGSEGSYTGVWSSSVDDVDVGGARSFGFNSHGNLDGNSYDDRYHGLSVRGVRA